MKTPVSPTTYALLGMLAIRPWTGYELTNQLRRSLHFVWPSSEGHLYREQKRLIELGWAEVTREPAGKRYRNRYAITVAGREALRTWLGTEPGEPRLEIEGLVRILYADQSGIDDLLRSIETTERMARSMLGTLTAFAGEYLEPGGPLSMLESGGGERPDGVAAPVFRGRPQVPERLHVVALVLDVTTSLLAELAEALSRSAEEVQAWPSPTDDRLTPLTRARLERILERGARAAVASRPEGTER